jgi:hypothetical protein
MTTSVSVGSLSGRLVRYYIEKDMKYIYNSFYFKIGGYSMLLCMCCGIYNDRLQFMSHQFVPFSNMVQL